MVARRAELLEHAWIARPRPRRVDAAGFASAVLHGRAVHLLSPRPPTRIRAPARQLAEAAGVQSRQPRPLSME